MAINKAKKADILKDLEGKFARAKTVVWTHYQGLDVNSMSKVRKGLHAEGVDYSVAKKTLIKLAAKKAGFKEIPAELEDGAIGVVFGYGDEVLPAKLMHNFGKEHEKIKLVGAWVDGEFLNQQQVVEFAKIPGREELLAKFLYLCNAPLSGFVGVSQGVIRKFVIALSEIQKLKTKQL